MLRLDGKGISLNNYIEECGNGKILYTGARRRGRQTSNNRQKARQRTITKDTVEDYARNDSRQQRRTTLFGSYIA